MYPPAIIPVDDRGAPKGDCCHLANAPIPAITTIASMDGPPMLICVVCHTIDHLRRAVRGLTEELASHRTYTRQLELRLEAAGVIHASGGHCDIGYDAKGNERFEGPPLLAHRVAALEKHAGVQTTDPVERLP
jgi:hypothetical protein